ncbi:Tyrosine-protein phosphatase non-receptor type 13 isoform 2 [Schistosoma japonicum]|uniref:Tyrosine-protein phosphatase non-receptor type 13 isoform 2 n=1 Tax=Schistosoma japonicum TaxID=6182 RepID=A0A4Z2D1T1_SCHJA|nr:Tyrosine-protein phosphatase non-receptor type 13 isoform 2 [Schistosoma japonicum]
MYVILMFDLHCCKKRSRLDIVRVVFLDDEQIFYKITNYTLVEDLFHIICSSIELRERDIFGLAIPSDEGWLFLEPSVFMHKIIGIYLTPTKRVCSSDILLLTTDKYQCTSSLYPTVYFRIRFYIPIHCLNERVTQHIYYMQLRKNQIVFNLFCDSSVYLQLAAFALQAELGNAPKSYDPASTEPYFRLELYYPEKFIKLWDSVELAYYTYIHHSSIRNTTAYLAEFHFIHLATKLNSDFNLHLYPIVKPSQKCRFSVWIGVSPNGFTLYQHFPDDWIIPTNRIKWNDVKRIYYDHHTVTVHLHSKAYRRDFKMQRTLSARHLFGLITNMHFYQLIAEMSATHSNDLLETIVL